MKNNIIKVVAVGLFIAVSMCGAAQELTTQRAVNTAIYLFHIIGTDKNNINSFIPLYGKNNSTLILNIYPASKYYDQWMKNTEYPQEQYFAYYDSKGNLYSWKKSGEDITAYLRWSNDGDLYGMVKYNDASGERVSWTDYFKYASVFSDQSKKYYADRGWQLFLEHGSKYPGGVWNAETWWNGSVCGYKISQEWKEYSIARTGFQIKSSTMVQKWGLSWGTNVTNPSMLKVLDIPWDLRPITDCNPLGLPKWDGMGNFDIYTLREVVRNNRIYEYTWK